MLVYANAFRFRPDVSVKTPVAAIARWLISARHESPRLSISDLVSDGRIQFRSGAHVEVVSADGEPRLYSLRYHHADSDVPGRVWFTEIGMAEELEVSSELTIVVRTDEVSSRVTTPITASRPALIAMLASDGLFDHDTPGLEIKRLPDEYAAEALRVSLEDPKRRHAYVIVSPTEAGDYVVTPEIIRGQVLGLAEVVQIPQGTSTYPISAALGKDFSSWGGAITIVLPPRGSSNIHSIKFLPNQIATFQAEGRRIEAVVLEAIAHRSNPLLHAKHISPGKVRDAKQRRELALRKKEAERSGDLREFTALLEQENDQLRRAKDELEEQLLEEQVAREDEARGLRYENDGLKFQLNQVSDRRTEPSSVQSDEEFRAATLAVVAGDATPEQSLLFIERLFPERIEVLPSAYKSAKDSKQFRHREKAFGLLRKLATEYYDAIAAGGKGNAQARQLFGNAYGASESEPVENNKRARELRTFDHHGAPVEMMQHLKIGIKDSAAETLRIHFEWDPTERKVVIGHCGPHLPFK